MLMSLGLFVFSMHTAAYQELQRQTNWRHAANARVGARAGYQYVGPGDETITLSGWLAAGQMGMPRALNLLRDMGNSGKAWVLMDGLGRFFGIYVITDLAETGTYFTAAGQPRKTEFSLGLTRIDEAEATGLLGDLSLQGIALGAAASLLS